MPMYPLAPWSLSIILFCCSIVVIDGPYYFLDFVLACPCCISAVRTLGLKPEGTIAKQIFSHPESSKKRKDAILYFERIRVYFADWNIVF